MGLLLFWKLSIGVSALQDQGLSLDPTFEVEKLEESLENKED